MASSPAVHFMEDSLAGIHVSMHNLSLSALHPELVMFFFFNFEALGQCWPSMVGNNNAFNSSGEDIYIFACTYNSTEGDFLRKKAFNFFSNPGPSQEDDTF